MRNLKFERLGLENANYQGYLMKIIEYNDTTDIFVEFQDSYKSIVHTDYICFKKGCVKNPYHPEVCGVGMIGEKCKDASKTKEYKVWSAMLTRCYSDKYKEKEPTYQDVTCCKEWHVFDNFYTWMRSQSNYEKWSSSSDWYLDKDILIKGNKIYGPTTCCLVPRIVNNLFIKRTLQRGDLPIGVIAYFNKYRA